MRRVRLSDYKDPSENEDVIKDAIKTSTESIITKNLMSDNSSVYVPKLEIEQGSSENDAVSDNEPEESNVVNTYESDPIASMFGKIDSNKYNSINNRSVNSNISKNDSEKVENQSDISKNVSDDTENHKSENQSERKARTIVMPGAGSVVTDIADDSKLVADDKLVHDVRDTYRPSDESNTGKNQSSMNDASVSGVNDNRDDRIFNENQNFERRIDRSASMKPRTICDDSENSFYISRVEKVPKHIMDFIYDQFDLSKFGRKLPSMGAVFTAYVFIKEGYPSDMPIPQRASEVVDLYKGDYEVSSADIQDRLLTLTNRLSAEFDSVRQLIRQDVMKKLTAVEIISIYDVFRQMQFSVQDRAGSPEDVDFQERGMAEMQRSLERQTVNKLEKDKIDNGHDVYTAKYKEGR